MKIVWDEPKRQQNIAKHGLDFADLSIEFFLIARIEITRNARFLAIGDHDGRIIVAVVFKPLGSEALSVISMDGQAAKKGANHDWKMAQLCHQGSWKYSRRRCGNDASMGSL